MQMRCQLSLLQIKYIIGISIEIYKLISFYLPISIYIPIYIMVLIIMGWWKMILDQIKKQTYSKYLGKLHTLTELISLTARLERFNLSISLTIFRSSVILK